MKEEVVYDQNANFHHSMRLFRDTRISAYHTKRKFETNLSSMINLHHLSLHLSIQGICGLPKGLNIKSISTLYHECHTSSYISSRLKGDAKVNHCLDSQLERESTWTRKISQMVKSNDILDSINENHSDSSIKQKQKLAKSEISQNSSNQWQAHVKTLVVQGRFLDLIAEEEKAFDWKSVG